MMKLKAEGLSMKIIDEMPEIKLKALLKDVGFHNRKTRHIKEMTNMIINKHGGQIPESYEELVELPGVGGKMSKLFMKLAYDKDVGISVDTHVHRIVNRLEWTHHPTFNPLTTAESLEKWLPKEKWHELN